MWHFIKKRFIFKRITQKTLLFLLLTFCLFFTTFFIIHNLSAANDFIRWKFKVENQFGCKIPEEDEEDGWRSHFVASEEEKRVFQSVRLEHIHLLEKLEEATAKLDAINKLIPIREAELKELEIRIEELKLLRKEYSDRRNVQPKLPHPPILWNNNDLEERISKSAFKSFEESIDFSRCSITKLFRIFVYPLAENSSELAQNFHHEFLNQKAYITTKPEDACLFVPILDLNQNFESNKLPHFGPNGRNHLILDLSGKLQPETIGAAMLVSNGISAEIQRFKMDIAANLNVPPFDPNLWQKLPQLLPAYKKYLIGFVANQAELDIRKLEDLKELKKSMESAQDEFLIDIDCPKSKGQLCYNHDQRISIGRQSTFLLIFSGMASFQERFYESLESGSIPVVCSLHQPLPFEEVLDWRLATIRIAPSQFPELHFILRSIPTADLLEMKRKGRFFFEHLLADTRVLTRSILSTLRYRLQLPGVEEPEPEAVPLYSRTNGNWTYPSFISTVTKPPYDDEYLGPIEMSLESPQYTHNFTEFSLYSSKLWNEFPFATAYSSCFLPTDHPMPSDSEFNEDTAFGLRPILPGSGLEFAQALGGNRQREQFTIVIVSFNREQVLANTLEKLIGLPYLNRVIVVWNDVDHLPTISAWPKLRVPLLFVNGTRNSLNKRFIPYKEIQTEAVLSMDDDIDLKQYEIIFAFRVWREQRDRIVGFPARYHARFGNDNFYNSNHTCQYSIILTGAAFLHKFYLQAYTHHMPTVIREKVDEWMNCEDLAMNFLVSHLTRKPPIKTTSKWTCPTCEETLSNDLAHFNERHECIRFFTSVYGYNPLLFSQFRADSVLFKTRVPANHQKCFRYV